MKTIKEMKNFFEDFDIDLSFIDDIEIPELEDFELDLILEDIEIPDTSFFEDFDIDLSFINEIDKDTLINSE